MGFFTEALPIHNARLKLAAGESVTYKRGGSQVTLTAVLGQTTFDEIGGDGEIHAQIKSVDFIVVPSELILGGSVEEPTRGDTITRENGEVFDVMPGSNGRHWTWSEGNQSHIRIHTVRRVKS